MTDPLSIVGSVAGVIALCARTSKVAYQFISTILDAPKEVHAITSSLYGMNIALSQIQTLLLDLTYASQIGANDLSDLEKSVSNCTASLAVVEDELKGVCQAGSEDLTTKKTWHRVKYVFEKEVLRDAFARLEGEKGTLQLILTTLNSKSMADVLRIINRADQVVQKNHQVLKRIELRMTRVLQDAIGRSYTSTSSVSLDSVCSQAEIERMLTSAGSSLNLTLTDMTDDSASIIVGPDTLSGVDCVSAKITFPSREEERDSETTSLSSEVPETPRRVTVESYFKLDDTLDSNSAHDEIQSIKRTPTAETIISSVQSSRLPKTFKSKQQLKLQSNPLFVSSSVLESIKQTIVSCRVIQGALSASSSHIERLERAKEHAESLIFIMDSFLLGSNSNSYGKANWYLKWCLERAMAAAMEYWVSLEKLYTDSKKRTLLVQIIQGSVDKLGDLWLVVEKRTDELDRAINMALMLDLHRNNTYQDGPLDTAIED